MAFGTVLSVAQTLFAALQCSQIKEMWPMFGYKSELMKLQQTVSTIKAVLIDAETKKVLSHEAQLYIEELKEAVFDADDLFDEFVTLAEQNRLTIEGGKLSKKVRLFFCRFKHLCLGKMSQTRLQKVSHKLDAISSNHRKFGFSNESDQSSKRRREDSCSHVYAADIIGREVDVENIVSILLNSDVEEDVSFLSIVGVGGLGKTALAQLLFNDERVSSAFSVKLWTCVADHDHETEQLDFVSILANVLESATGRRPQLGCSLDSVQKRLRAHLAGKRFILVLDDVWNENRDEWVKLAGYLTGGRRGSWVLVTTRSKETGRVIGNGRTYELQGLSKENSWKLFQRTAFGQGTLPDEFVRIGQDIVEGCANVPLAVRVVGSLLYGQRKSKWVSFQQNGLANVSGFENNDIMPILKLSYNYLKSPLKSCFSYCALFPKDFEIDKETLMGLWMAQGYITPSESGYSIEDVAEHYFFILLRRCFFQDVKKDEYGEIVSCKVHDLMHDIAKEVSAKEICEVNPNTEKNLKVSKAIRHFAVRGHKFMNNFSVRTHIRTYFQVSKVGGMIHVEKLLANCPSLRTLDLRSAGVVILPNSIGMLVHLRYLDLSFNPKLKLLPKSITKLLNLQTLNLLGCRGLKVLPKDLSKLVKLRVFDVKDCFLPLYMPSNFGRLTCLQKLDRFGMGDLNPNGKKRFAELEDLKALVNLKGSLGLQIRLHPSAPYIAKGGAYLSTLEHLSGVEIWYLRTNIPEEVMDKEAIIEYEEATVEYEEAILEDLQPHSNLKYLRLVEYNGRKLPSWAWEHNLASFLPNLIRVEFKECMGLHYLPWLGLLQSLKFLRLEILPNLEYLTNSIPESDMETVSLFPCLEHLYLENLPRLKGWWPRTNAGEGDCEVSSSPCLPQLKGLWIYECPGMATIPLCPRVEDLRIYDADRSLELKTLDRDMSKTCPREMRVTTGNVELLKLVPVGNFQCLKEMRIESDYKLKSLSEVEDLFKTCLSSLQCLEIWRCPKLRSLFGGLEHLTGLQKLHIRKSAGLLNNDDNGGVPWGNLAPTLQSLKLEDLPHLVNLPNEMQHLTSLESLLIVDCKGLLSVPDWMPNLTSLQKLEVRRGCTELKGRCTQLTGTSLTF
ncbi:putative disease resistance protein RGA1 [Silene latifolia]|uniref:putative disease resistance protein RGA1 n=1 Tax=Silene latifolia TaxID=37657 RepID=UPI003D77D379